MNSKSSLSLQSNVLYSKTTSGLQLLQRTGHESRIHLSVAKDPVQIAAMSGVQSRGSGKPLQVSTGIVVVVVVVAVSVVVVDVRVFVVRGKVEVEVEVDVLVVEDVDVVVDVVVMQASHVAGQF